MSGNNYRKNYAFAERTLARKLWFFGDFKHLLYGASTFRRSSFYDNFSYTVISNSKYFTLFKQRLVYVRATTELLEI